MMSFVLGLGQMNESLGPLYHSWRGAWPFRLDKACFSDRQKSSLFFLICSSTALPQQRNREIETQSGREGGSDGESERDRDRERVRERNREKGKRK